MVEVRKIGIPLLFVHSVLMLSLGMALFILGNSMTTPGVAAFGYTLAVILTSGCLPAACSISYRGGIGTIDSGRAGRSYLLAGALSFACVVLFWISLPANAEIHALPVLTGFYGIYWGLWNLGLALQLPDHSHKQTVLCVSGGMASALSVILATEFQFNDLNAVTALACYLLLIGMQGLLIVLWLFRVLEHTKTAESLSAGASAEHDLIVANLSISVPL